MSPNQPQDDAGERITPVAHQPPTSAAARPTAVSAERPFFWIAVALIVLLLCLVILWLPSQLNQREPLRQVADAAPQQKDEASTDKPEAEAAPAPGAADTEAVLAKRQTAQRIADALQLRRAISPWGRSGWR